MRFSKMILGGLLLAAATPAFAQDAAPAAEEPTPAYTITGGVTGITDYRFRGLSQSGEDPALQATININHESGFYVGTWASTIDDTASLPGYGDFEVDLYGGFTKTFDNGFGVDVGLLYYFYPDAPKANNTDFFEPYASVMYTAGPVTAKVGANYAWSGQDGLVDNDSLYLRGDVTVAVPGTPVSVLAHLGHTDGSLGILDPNGEYLDWSLGIEAVHDGFKLGVQYVDTDITENFLGVKYDSVIGADPTVLAYLSFNF